MPSLSECERTLHYEVAGMARHEPRGKGRANRFDIRPAHCYHCKRRRLCHWFVGPDQLPNDFVPYCYQCACTEIGDEVARLTRLGLLKYKVPKSPNQTETLL